jgi:hypothetical protein
MHSFLKEKFNPFDYAARLSHTRAARIWFRPFWRKENLTHWLTEAEAYKF